MQENVLLHRLRAMQVAGSAAAAEDRFPRFGVFYPLEFFFDRDCHGLYLHEFLFFKQRGFIHHEKSIVAEPDLQPWKRLRRWSGNFHPIAIEAAAMTRAGDQVEFRFPCRETSKVRAYRAQSVETLGDVYQINSTLRIQSDCVRRELVRLARTNNG